MSSKRALYQPVNQQNVETKERRKGLAQGRLVTDPVNYTPQGDLISTPSPSSTKAADGRKNSDPSTPQRSGRTASQFNSPVHVQPSKSLELSDSEDEAFFSPAKTNSKTGEVALPSVLMVDATRQTAGPNMSEVDIRLGFTHSPAKVICHSPSIVRASLSEQTGSVQKNRHVRVEQVPSVHIRDSDTHYSDVNRHEEAEHLSPSRQKSPAVIRERAIAGGAVDHSSTAKPEIAKMLFASEIEETGRVEKVPQYPPPKVAVQRHEEGSSLDSIDTFVSEVSSVSDISPLQAKPSNQPKTKSTVISTAKIQEKIKKKRREPKVVESRFMQASSKSVPMKANRTKDRSSSFTDMQSKRSLGQESRDLQRPRTAGKKFSPKPRTGSGTRSSIRLTVNEPDTSELRQILTDNPRSQMDSKDQGELRSIKTAGLPPKTNRSTPRTMARGADVSRDSNLGRKFASDISLNTTGQSVQNISEGNILDLSEIPTVGHAPHTHHESTHDMLEITDMKQGSKKKGKKLDKQLELDLLYSRYLQFVFLNARAKKAFQDQEKSALTQMYGLWEENDRMRQRKADLQQQLVKLRHLNKLDDTLHQQLTSLVPVTGSLDKLQSKYKVLAEALDTTRHQIPTRGIYIPDNEEHYQEQLLRGLEESEQLLGELSVMIRQQEPTVTEYSNSLLAMENTLDKEIHALNSCQELLSAAESLTMNEASLRIQDIQLAN